MAHAAFHQLANRFAAKTAATDRSFTFAAKTVGGGFRRDDLARPGPKPQGI